MRKLLLVLLPVFLFAGAMSATAQDRQPSLFARECRLHRDRRGHHSAIDGAQFNFGVAA